MRTLTGFLFGALALTLGVLSALVVGTTAVLPFVVLPRGRRERYTIVGAAAWAWFTVRVVLLARPRIVADAPLPDGQGALVVCNHRSWVDPLVLMYATRASGLSKQAILWIPFVGLYGWLSGSVFFDRGDPAQRARARREVMRLVRSGSRIQLFPEGTRTRDGALLERVHLVLVHDCYEAGLPVVPCALWGTERPLPPGRMVAFPFQPFDVSIGRALWPRDYPDADAFADAVWGDVKARVARIAGDVPGRGCPERGSNPHAPKGRGF